MAGFGLVCFTPDLSALGTSRSKTLPLRAKFKQCKNIHKYFRGNQDVDDCDIKIIMQAVDYIFIQPTADTNV